MKVKKKNVFAYRSSNLVHVFSIVLVFIINPLKVSYKTEWYLLLCPIKWKWSEYPIFSEMVRYLVITALIMDNAGRNGSNLISRKFLLINWWNKSLFIIWHLEMTFLSYEPKILSGYETYIKLKINLKDFLVM